MKPIRVLLFSQNAGGLEKCIQFLETEGGLKVTVILQKERALQVIKDGLVDVIVLVSFYKPPLHSVFDIAVEMFESGGEKIILLISTIEREMIVNAFTIGIINVLHHSSYEDLPDAIYEAYLSRSSIHTDAATVLRQELIRLRKKEWSDLLTHSEKQVLRLLSYSNSRKEVAAQLNITLDTVKVHIQRILKKLGVKTSIEAIRMAKWQHFFDDYEG